MSLAASALTVAILSSAAMAQDDDPGLDPSLPIPTLKYDRPPPDFSYELALQASFGTITKWQDEIPPWIGFGVRAGWGRNIPESYKHRIGINALLFVEGPLPVHMTAGIEPHLAWDYVTKKGLQVGAGVGPAALYHSKIEDGTSVLRKPGFGVSAAARVGWSQSWSRIGRRLFVLFEPKVRFMDGQFGAHGAIVVGSGKGY